MGAMSRQEGYRNQDTQFEDICTSPRCVLFIYTEPWFQSQDPEFQLVPLPKTNPVLIGTRWKQYHEALGIGHLVDYSWEVVQKEKPDIIHLLDFPYNGETRRDQLLQGKLTDNKYHLCVARGKYILADHLPG